MSRRKALTIFPEILDEKAVTTHMTGWEIEPGMWEITQSVQTTENGPLSDTQTRTENFERSSDIAMTFPPRTTTVLELKLVKKGVPYWSRPDLGIDREDVKVTKSGMTVKVHSLGSVDAPPAMVVVRDRVGNVVAKTRTPLLKAPMDLLPKTATVTLTLPAKIDLSGGSVTIESSGSVPEVTQLNNRVTL
jgi:hypothetical protein